MNGQQHYIMAVDRGDVAATPGGGQWDAGLSLDQVPVGRGVVLRAQVGVVDVGKPVSWPRRRSPGRAGPCRK